MRFVKRKVTGSSARLLADGCSRRKRKRRSIGKSASYSTRHLMTQWRKSFGNNSGSAGLRFGLVGSFEGGSPALLNRYGSGKHVET